MAVCVAGWFLVAIGEGNRDAEVVETGNNLAEGAVNMVWLGCCRNMSRDDTSRRQDVLGHHERQRKKRETSKKVK